MEGRAPVPYRAITILVYIEISVNTKNNPLLLLDKRVDNGNSSGYNMSVRCYRLDG